MDYKAMWEELYKRLNEHIQKADLDTEADYISRIGNAIMTMVSIEEVAE